MGDLNPVMAKIAADFLAAHPDAYLTSGRRSLGDQAQAMASNVVTNPQWIAETYVPGVARDACQAWVDGSTGPLTVTTVAAGLLSVLQSLDPADLDHLSWHLGGDAADFGPVGRQDLADDLKARVQAHILAGGNPASKLLTSEGGIPKLHVQAR